MKLKKIGYTLFLVLGIVSVIIGYFLLEGKWSGLLIGLGSGIFGGSSAQLIGYTISERNPTLQGRQRVEQNDERNVQIRNAAKAKAFDLKLYLSLPLLIVMIIAEVQVWVIMLMVAGYLIGWFVYLGVLSKLAKG